ncbi:MAG: portal protein [Magnetospirillum sp.]|nr:portal protein [Magnetospirillum sp.]
MTAPPSPAPTRVSAAAIAALRRQVDRRLVGLRPERMSYWNHWRELSDYILPRRGRFLITPNPGDRGDPRNQKIIDSTATLAARTLASGMMSGITSPARPWFRLTVGDSDLARAPAVKRWLDEVTRRMMRVFAKSNFYNALATVYEELGVFGTAVMVILEDYQDVIRCQPLTVGEYYLANSDRMSVDTLYREFTLTVAQAVAQFGLEACSATVQSMYRSGQLDQQVLVGHAIEPNDRPVPDDPTPRGMPFRSVYWELGSSQSLLLGQRGYREFPVCAPRWHVVGNDVYGRSPGMDALGDVKALQVEQKRKAQAIEKMVNPPMIADVSLRNQPATLLPGGVTYVPGNASGVGFKPVYEVSPPLAGLVEDIQEVQRRIQQVFYADLWLMISQLDTVRTATEIVARKEEKLLMLGPVLERFHAECLNPAIARTFGVMERAGLLPPAPAELARQAVQVDYISMLAQAQKAVATTGIERLVGFVGSLAGAHPPVLDTIDFDEAVDEYADMLGVSPRLLTPRPQVDEIRRQRARQAAQAQAMNTSLAAVQGAQTLSKIDVGGGQNALQKMLGWMGA